MTNATAPSLELAADGTFTGTDGCNMLGGTWEQEGHVVTFADVFTTLMACPGVDTWLAGVSSATVDGDTLTVLDVNGSETGFLERS